MGRMWMRHDGLVCSVWMGVDAAAVLGSGCGVGKGRSLRLSYLGGELLIVGVMLAQLCD
jgi:hypothetical protein